MMRNTKNVVIIGGGLIGLSVARALMVSGYQKIFVIQQNNERSGMKDRPPSGIIRQYHTSAVFRGRLKTATNLLRSYQLERTKSLFTFGPSLVLGTNRDRQELTATKPEPLDWSAAGPDHLPDGLIPHPINHPFWFSYKGGGRGDTRLFEETIKTELEKSDRVTLRPSTEVRDGHREQEEWVLYLSSSERLTAGVIVNTSGVHANELGGRLGLEQQKYAILRKTHYYSRQSLLPERYGVFLVRTLGHTFRTVNGGTLISSCDERPQEINNAPFEDREIPSFQTSTGQNFPNLPPVEVQQSWFTTFSRTEDRSPIIHRDPAEESVIWATGLNEYRLPLSLWVGQHVNDILSTMSVP